MITSYTSHYRKLGPPVFNFLIGILIYIADSFSINVNILMSVSSKCIHIKIILNCIK